MNAKKLFTLSLGLTLMSFGCSNDDDNSSSSTTSVFGKTYTLVTGSPTVEANSVTGTGTLNFGESLVTERKEETNFLITLDLSAGNDSYVNIHTFSDSSLANGQIITLGRQENGDFAMQYTKADGTKETVTEFDETIDASSGSFTFSVDVHNGEDNGSHVISWKGDNIPGSPTEATDGLYGAGRYVGLDIKNATVTAFSVGSAEAADDE